MFDEVVKYVLQVMALTALASVWFVAMVAGTFYAYTWALKEFEEWRETRAKRARK